MTDRYETGGSTNGADAEQAIDCLDHPVSRNPSRYPALAGNSWPGRLRSSAPAGLGTARVRHLAGLPDPDPGAGVGPRGTPILVVGTTGDPVTPYAWAVSLAKELTGGVLLTWEGQSHVAYFYSPCVRAYVQAYLVAGTLPATGTTCTD